MKTPRNITFLVDRPHSWYNLYLEKLLEEVRALGHVPRVIRHYAELGAGGDLAFFLSCGAIVPSEYLTFHRHNLVVHASALPLGKGFAPLSWQILEGKNRIPVTLFEAVADVDCGAIYLRDEIVLEGHELLEEIHAREGAMINRMIVEFITREEELKPRPQVGPSSFYPRRRPRDSRIDLDRPLAEQFNLLRIVDNEQYPAFFERDGHTYILKIYKAPSS